jgi:hypothetical protein
MGFEINVRCECGNNMLQSSMQRWRYFCLNRACGKHVKLEIEWWNRFGPREMVE